MRKYAMNEAKKAPDTRLNPETKVARDIFAPERGVNSDMPLTEFLTNVEKETRDRLDGDRKRRST